MFRGAVPDLAGTGEASAKRLSYEAEDAQAMLSRAIDTMVCACN